MSEPKDSSAQDKSSRKFLVVVDETPECEVAIYFASRRAAKTKGRVALLYVVPPADFQHWQSVKEVMEDEARDDADRILQNLAENVKNTSGAMPELIIREGNTREEIHAQIDEDPRIKILVLGAASGGSSPGPLVSSLAKGGFVDDVGQGRAVPVTVVPGNLSKEELDELA